MSRPAHGHSGALPLGLILGMLILIGALSLALPTLQRLGERLGGDPGPVPVPLRGASAPPAQSADGDVSTEWLYRWRARDGTVHVHSAAPPAGTPAERIPYRREPTAAPPTETPSAPSPAPGLPESPVSVYTPSGVDDLLDLVDDTAKRLEDRERDLERLEDQL